MKHLRVFVEQENQLRSIFNRPVYYLNALSAEDVEGLFMRLDSNLSPEVLHRDGEAKKSEVIRNRKLYRGAIQDLLSMGFKPSRELYNI
jgi:hypothetical protein